jgi:hypothetical protein
VFESDIETREITIRQPFDTASDGVPFGPLFSGWKSVHGIKFHRKCHQYKKNGAYQINALHRPAI